MLRAIARLAAVAALLSAAGCATPMVASGCKAQLAAELPVRLVKDFVVVPVRLNGQPAEFLVDTAFTQSLVTPETAQRLGLASDPRQVATLNGAGGEARGSYAPIADVAVGTASLAKQTLVVAPLPNKEPGISGVLGADWLSRFDVDIDVPRQRLALWRGMSCELGRDPLHVPHFTVPMVRAPNGLILVPVALEGKGMLALFDTGAGLTTVTEAAAIFVGVPAAELAGTGVGIATGLDLNAIPVHVHRFAEFWIGPERFRDLLMPIAKLRVPVVGALIGANYLQHHRVWIPASGQQMLVVPLP